MHENPILHKRRPNHHSTHSDGTPRRARPTTSGTGRRTRSRAIRSTSSPVNANIQTIPVVAGAASSPISTIQPASASSSRVAPSLPVVVSNSRSSSLTPSPSTSSGENSNSIQNAESSQAPKQTTPNNANKYIPAILASLFVVLAACLLVFCLHRRRKLARQRDALTSLAPSPYQIEGQSDSSIDEKGYAYNQDINEKQPYQDQDQYHHQAQSQEYLNSDPSPQANYAGRPSSFLESIRNTFLRRKSTKRQDAQQPTNHPWDWQNNNRAESPPIPKVPVITQVPLSTHDPFRDGFGPGASQLATGLASTTMTSQNSTDSHSSLSHKQSLSSNASTSVARRWPNGVSKDGHESLSQGPNVRTLYTGVQVEGTAEEDEDDAFSDAYADGYHHHTESVAQGNAEEELGRREELSTPSMMQEPSIRTMSYSSRPDEQARHLSQSTARSIRFGTLRSESDNGQEVIEPAWQRS